MSRLKWKPMPPVMGTQIWGAERGRHTFVKSFTEGYGWCVSWKEWWDPGSATVRHPDNPFDTEHKAEEAINRQVMILEAERWKPKTQ